jgi:hypothetical protein
MITLLFQLRHESDEPRIFSQAVQVGVILEQRVTREAVVGSGL